MAVTEGAGRSDTRPRQGFSHWPTDGRLRESLRTTSAERWLAVDVIEEIFEAAASERAQRSRDMFRRGEI